MNKILKFLLTIFLNFLLFSTLASSEEEKIKIGLLIPMTGENKNLGAQIINATRLALKDINNNKIEIYPKDTKSNPEKTLRSASQGEDFQHCPQKLTTRWSTDARLGQAPIC